MMKPEDQRPSSPNTSPVLRKRSSASTGSPPTSPLSTSSNSDNQNNNNEQPQLPTLQQGDVSSNNNNTTTTTASEHDMEILQRFWSKYDTIIILSICSIVGIAFRMMSATWFRMELGAVFSEDSALGTNLPLNIWSCFLMGLLCSGREAMGIVTSKVLVGSNLYPNEDSSGRGLFAVCKGAYRSTIDAGKACINRLLGYGNVPQRSPTSSENVEERPTSFSQDTDDGLHRRSRRADNSQSTNEVEHEIHDNESITGLLGLDILSGLNRTSEDEIRDVQLRGLGRRIIASPCLVFFSANKIDTEVMEHYENERVPSLSNESQDNFEIGELDDDEMESGDIEMKGVTSSGEASGESSDEVAQQQTPTINTESEQLSPPRNNRTSSNNSSPIHNFRRQASSIEEHVGEIIHDINDHVTTFRRVSLIDGWKTTISADQMKDIILLGLRVGFCGALSTFSSLNASVIRLLKAGSIGEGIVGYALSIQLGIVSYRFGQHIAVYLFVWRRRRETKRAERRGYGLRLRRQATEDEQQPVEIEQDQPSQARSTCRRLFISMRTFSTLLLAAMIIGLSLAVYFVPSHQQYLLSLLFTPFGCLARWKLMDKYNKKIQGLPLGTFVCNIGGCALSGSLASFLAGEFYLCLSSYLVCTYCLSTLTIMYNDLMTTGNPGPEESIVLQSMIAGLAGSLSTFAQFIIEILSLIDPIIFKFDGVVYSIITVLLALVVGFLGSQAKSWADEIQPM